MQMALDGDSGLVVQQAGEPSVALEDELAREEDAVRKIGTHALRQSGELADDVDAVAGVAGGRHPLADAVADEISEAALDLDTQHLDRFGAVIAVRVDLADAHEDVVGKMAGKQAAHPQHG